mmetsp:Transcript_25775/g.63408  ORF Transcript_25775/g.63408 Transcript_25775/m.63408 type:complete len:528 (-) Transcript_25775:116-1699(-)
MSDLVLVAAGAALGAARLLGHDDLVHAQHGAHRLHRQLERPPLDEVHVGDGLAGRQVHPALLGADVHAGVDVARRVRRVQVVHHVGGVQPGVLRQRARHHLQRAAELLDGVLVQARLLAAERGQAVRQLDLRGAARRQRAAVLGERLEGVDAVVHGALDVVHSVLGGAPQHDGGHAAGLVVLLHHHALGAADLLHVDLAHEAQLVRRRAPQLDDAGGVGGAAEPAQLELGRQLDGHQPVALDEVHGHLAEGLPRHDHRGAGVRDHLDVVLHHLLLAAAVVLQVRGARDQHRALGLRAAGVHRAPEHRHLGVLDVLHGALAVALDDHALHHRVVVQRTPHDLAHAHVVHVEVGGVLGAHVDARLRARLRQDLLVPELLRGQRALDALGDGDLVLEVQRLAAGDHQLVQPRQGLPQRLLVPLDDLRRVQPVADQLLCHAEQLTPEGNHEVGAVADLLLLRLRRHHQQLSGGVRHLQLAHDHRRIRRHEQLVQVVDHHLVHAVGAQGGARDLGQLLARLHVLDHRLVEAA